MQTIAIVVSLAFSVVAIALTTRAVRAMLGVIRAGAPALGRTDRPAARLLNMLKETLLHTRMLQWTWVGILHWFAFAAFIVLSSAVMQAFFQIFDAEFAWPIVGTLFLYEWVCEVIGLLGALAIIPLIIYRIRKRPSANGRSSRFFGSTMWQAYFVEAMVLLESSAILFIRGAEFNLAKAHGGEPAEHATAFHFPLSQFFANLFPTGHDSIASLENWIYFIAMVKIVSAMAWLMVISSNLTMGVAWHRFTAFFNIFFKRESSGATALGRVKPLTSGGKAITLDDIDDLDEDSVLGAGSIEDFSWKGILDFTTCTECGRCQSQCPAWNTEKPLSPKLMMMGLREHAYAKATGDESHQDRALVGKTSADVSAGMGTEVLDWFYNPEGGDFVIDEDVLWSCTNCGACVQQCPVDIEHVDHIVDMRRYQVLVESNFPAELNGLFKGLENKGNPWNMSPNARMDWAKDLPFDVKVVGEDLESLESVDWLFWVGCAGAYEDRAKKTTRAVAELLDMAGVSFGVLGNGETCTGDSARRAGNEFVFQGLAQQNIETFREFKVKKVVSTCAHCFNTLKNEYKDLGIELEVVHHTQLLNRLVREGKLTPIAEGAGAAKRSITYHDPCFLGRHNQVYTPPRDLLQILPGAEVVEMERNSEKSFCCGAGGARMWMEETIGERINVNRTTEAVGTGADQIAVGCPFCRVMLADGLTKLQADGAAREEVEVLDVAQMLLASVKGEVATRVRPASAPAGTPAAAAKVATSAEPSAGDVTVTADTVVETADAGPAAKASGGSSLFDTPAPEAPAAPASGGSLFDTPAPAEAPKAAPASGGSLFDVAPAAPAEPAKAEAPKAEAPKADLGSGGSLFDVAPTAPAEPAKADEPAEPAKAEAAPAPAAEPAKADLGSGGSLFDIAAPATPAAAPAAKAEAPEAEAPVETTPAEAPAAPAAPAAEAKPSVDLNAGGSLFDIPAAPAPTPTPEAATPTAEVEETREEEAATVADAPEPTPAPEATEATEAAAPTEAPDAAAVSQASAPAEPAVDLSSVGSLFDIVAAKKEEAAAPAAPAQTDAPAEAEAPAAPAAETEAAAEAPAEDPETIFDESDEPEPETPAEAEPAAAEPEAAGPEAAEPEAAPDEKPADEKPKSSGATNTPRTDVDINQSSSLFDL